MNMSRKETTKVAGGIKIANQPSLRWVLSWKYRWSQYLRFGKEHGPDPPKTRKVREKNAAVISMETGLVIRGPETKGSQELKNQATSRNKAV